MTRRLRVEVVLDADVVSMTPDWVGELARPILRDKADFLCPAYARHRAAQAKDVLRIL